MLTVGFSLAFRDHASEKGARRRVHPWTVSATDPGLVYVDFKALPGEIPAVLEDLRPYAGRRFAQEFYELIRWMNAPERVFETNDFAFRGPRSHPDKHNPWPLRCDGRLMFLFRDLVRNCSREEMEAAVTLIIQSLNEGSSLDRATVGLSLHPTTYSALSPDPKLGADGLQFQFSFWAYGNNPSECFGAISQLVRSISERMPKVEDACRHPTAP